MKRFLTTLLFLSVLILSSCASSDIVNAGGAVVRGDIPKPTNLASYYSKENIVYITKSGKKYHKEGCRFLKSSKIMISLEQAQEEGLTPCGECLGDNGNN